MSETLRSFPGFEVVGRAKFFENIYMYIRFQFLLFKLCFSKKRYVVNDKTWKKSSPLNFVVFLFGEILSKYNEFRDKGEEPPFCRSTIDKVFKITSVFAKKKNSF